MYLQHQGTDVEGKIILEPRGALFSIEEGYWTVEVFTIMEWLLSQVEYVPLS